MCNMLCARDGFEVDGFENRNSRACCNWTRETKFRVVMLMLRMGLVFLRGGLAAS